MCPTSAWWLTLYTTISEPWKPATSVVWLLSDSNKVWTVGMVGTRREPLSDHTSVAAHALLVPATRNGAQLWHVDNGFRAWHPTHTYISYTNVVHIKARPTIKE